MCDPLQAIADVAKGAVELVTNPVGKIGQMTGDFAGGDVGKAIRDISSLAGGFTSPFGVAGAVRTGTRMGGDLIGGETGRGLGEWGKSIGSGLDVMNYANPQNWKNVPVIGEPMRAGTQYLQDALLGKSGGFQPSSYEDFLKTGSLSQTGARTAGLLEQGYDLITNPLVQKGLDVYTSSEQQKQAKQEAQKALNEQVANQRQLQLASILGGSEGDILPYLGQGDNPLDVYAKYATAGQRVAPTYYQLPVNYVGMGG